MDDLAVIVVSYGSAKWLSRCLETLFDRAGDIKLDVVVADNDPGDDVPPVVARFPQARLVPCENRGFAAGNNVGLQEVDARYVLFLNPDTEIRSGTLEDLVRRLDARPEIGAIGVRQVLPSGQLFPTVRRFPSARRALAEALAVERLGVRRRALGERVLDLSLYDSELPCDWTSGSFLLVRAEALLSAGIFDERFFLFSEEVDLCMRIRAAGWEIVHFPYLEILHYSCKAGVNPRLEAQQAFARSQFARKHFVGARRKVFLAALLLRFSIRGALAPLDRENAVAWREAARRALPLILGRGEPPFVAPPPSAVTAPPPPVRSAAL